MAMYLTFFIFTLFAIFALSQIGKPQDDNPVEEPAKPMERDINLQQVSVMTYDVVTNDIYEIS